VRRHRALAGGIGLSAVVGFLLLSVTTGYASTGSVTSTSFFPSSSSTVVASIGFINGTEVGYFWSASRGDSVSQTVNGPASVKRAILKVDVVTNSLTPGAEVDWNLYINNVVVGQFKVVSGKTGLVKFKASFGKLRGPSYNILLKVTNEVPAGDGSMTLAYAGGFPHTISLYHT
jgi:hypothetical protein